MRLPDFFIIGAPKSGTTALYDTVRQHPGIYMSPVKEPHYFACEGRPPIYPGPLGSYLRRHAVWEPRMYAQLFAGVPNETAVGEASPPYLYSPLAARRIRHNLPQSRIVAILRHPAERAYSNYQQMRQHEVEPAPTFEEALAKEEQRKEAGWLPWLYYRTNGYYHAPLTVWYEHFPRERIRIYLFEDWKERPLAMLRDLFGFLEVDQDFSPAIRRSNVTLLPKSRRLHRWAMHPEGLDRRAPFIPPIVRRSAVAALRRIDTGLNLAPPPSLDPEIRASLTAVYREDIMKLQDLIGRDLSHWLG
jgi:hypothetical protein